MNRKILDPRWANQEKTHIIAKFQYDDGKLVTASISNPEGEINPDWKEIIDTFGEKTLDDNTNFALQVHYQNKQQKQEQQKLHIERMQQQALFNAKADAFNIEQVRTSKNIEMKAKIRKAESVTEVLLYSVLVMLDNNRENQLILPDTISNTIGNPKRVRKNKKET